MRGPRIRGGARLVVDCMLKANDIVAGLHSRPPERVGARTAATPSTGQRTIMIKVYAFSTPNSVRVPIGLEEMGSTTSCSRSMSAKANRNFPRTWH